MILKERVNKLLKTRRLVKLYEQIFKLPRATAARLIINGKTCTLGEDLRNYVRTNVQIKRENAEKKTNTGNKSIQER
jgi:hypothetical protein